MHVKRLPLETSEKKASFPERIFYGFGECGAARLRLIAGAAIFEMSPDSVLRHTLDTGGQLASADGAGRGPCA